MSNNDLISREALKKAIEEVEYNYDGYEPCDLGRFRNKVDELIDNAPTVTPIDDVFSTAIDKYGDNTFSVSVISSKGEKIEFERVKTGEWKCICSTKLWDDFLLLIINKIVGKKYGCCGKIKNCHRCCVKNGYEEW